MELIDGETLADALQRGRLTPDRALAVVSGVGAALDHVHRRGVVHRDVKPANILLARDGQVKLADLGIARMLEGTAMTRSGILLGTAAYMSPEQLEGGEITHRTDVYALAAVAFEALSGRRARPGRNPLEVAHQAASGAPPDLSTVWPEAPAAAGRVIAAAMAHDPRDRTRSAGAFASQLERAFDAWRPDAPLLTPRPRKATPATVAAAATEQLAVSSLHPRARRVAVIGALLAAVIALAVMGSVDRGEEPAKSSGAGAAAGDTQKDESSSTNAQPEQRTPPMRRRLRRNRSLPRARLPRRPRPSRTRRESRVGKTRRRARARARAATKTTEPAG